MMKIAIFGATGEVGLQLTQAAIERNFEVKALVRSPEKLGALSSHIEVIQGDYFDKHLVLATIEGVDAVLSTVGPPMGRNHSLTPDDFEQGMINVMEAMKVHGVHRFINISSSATSYTGERIAWTRQISRLFLKVVAPIMTPAKERELAILMNTSNVDWTNIRVPYVGSKVKGALIVDETNSVDMKVNLAQLADFMLDNINSTEWLQKAPFVGSK